MKTVQIKETTYLLDTRKKNYIKERYNIQCREVGLYAAQFLGLTIQIMILGKATFVVVVNI